MSVSKRPKKGLEKDQKGNFPLFFHNFFEDFWSKMRVLARRGLALATLRPGFAELSRKKFELGLIRNHYVGRTFIEPSQQIRSLGVKLKLSSTKSIVKNKSIIYLPL